MNDEGVVVAEAMEAGEVEMLEAENSEVMVMEVVVLVVEAGSGMEMERGAWEAVAMEVEAKEMEAVEAEVVVDALGSVV